MEKMPKCSVEKEFEKKRAYDVIKRLDETSYSLESCRWACRAFASIAGLAMQTKNAESMADFLDDGGCEALVNILHKHGALCNEISAYGAMTVAILSWSLRDMKEFLGEIGTCELIVFVTSMHIGDPLVSEYGSAAIGLLAKDNISNSFKLSQAGACDILSQVGNFGFNIRNERCVDVATNVCLAFAQLSEAANANSLMECGACAIIVAFIRLHKKSEEFAAAAVKGLCGLSSLNIKHREELGRVGACECILDIIQLHTNNTAIIQEATEAIMHLSLSPNNTIRLGKAGACEIIVSSLKHKLMEYVFGAEVCSGAMLNLVTYGVAAKENRLLLIEAGAIEQLRKAQLSTKASYRARENILKLLEILGADPVPGSTSNGRSTTPLGFINGSNGNGISNGKHNGSITVNNNSKSSSIVVHGSEMKGDTIPLAVEIREVIEYDSLSSYVKTSESPDDLMEGGGHSNSNSNNNHNSNHRNRYDDEDDDEDHIRRGYYYDSNHNNNNNNSSNSSNMNGVYEI